MRILAVDDDPIILELLGELIGSIGEHTLQTAESGAEALELIGDGDEFDCFLLDIQMPRMDGIELCREIRSRDEYRKSPILMITAMSEKRYIDAAFGAGATDYLNKPFEMNEVRARLGLVAGLVNERRRVTSKLFATERARDLTEEHAGAPLHEPFDIRDVDGVIEFQALENYVTQLSRKDLFGSSVFGFSIREIEELYENLSVFDFQCMIVDVSEALSDCMKPHQFLISYVGNGTFVCVTEGGWSPDLKKFLDYVHRTIREMELHLSNGEPLNVRVAPGKVIRLTWHAGERAISALAEAHETAEQAAREAVQRKPTGVWYLDRSA
ncbi:response regulator [Pelagovum pacificum]|uniref:Response regulator n=1 Tax=Pelagovum pacificum TaxID=2588711 RepID=A0A5C5G980_9RHOB|nr:response regulator [Pelagovum pacificum]QQA42033.1 response regulator [Pelagovum pacificum]TNY31123.1 response regulator [Pelagovum pacificum]